jgi:hypothetical protein
MRRVFIAAIVSLLILGICSGCRPQQSVTNEGPLSLQVTSPRDGFETSWGFTTVSGIVSATEASVTVNGTPTSVSANGSFESDYLLLSEGANELHVVATLDDYEVSKTITIIYNLNLHVSLSLHLEPGEDWFKESPSEINGRVSDPRAEVTVNRKRADVSQSGFFSVMLDLTKGINQLTAVAKFGGQVAQDTEEAIYVPPVPLELNITTPSDGDESMTDLIKVAGTVSDPQAEVVINDVQAMVTTAGNFYAYSELDEGDNHIEAVATRNGEQTADEVYITYHPSEETEGDIPLSITSPRSNAEYRVNLLPVTGTVGDSTATVIVNGAEAQVTSDGIFHGNAILEEGGNNIEIDAIKGNLRTSRSILVTFEPALVVYLDANWDSEIDYTKTSLTVTGRVNKPEATVTMNEHEVTVDPDGIFWAEVPLTVGSNTITAVATLGSEHDEAQLLFMVDKSGSISPVPGYSGFSNAIVRYEQEVSLRAGDTEQLDITLETRKDGPGEFSGWLVRVADEYGLMPLSLPEGMDVYLDPPDLKAYPNTTYNLSLVFVTSDKLTPSTYYLHFYYNLEEWFYGSGWIKVNMVS